MPELTDAQKNGINFRVLKIYRAALRELMYQARHSNDLATRTVAISIQSEMDYELDGLYVDGDRGAPWRCFREGCRQPLGHDDNAHEERS